MNCFKNFILVFIIFVFVTNSFSQEVQFTTTRYKVGVWNGYQYEIYQDFKKKGNFFLTPLIRFKPDQTTNKPMVSINQNNILSIAVEFYPPDYKKAIMQQIQEANAEIFPLKLEYIEIIPKSGIKGVKSWKRDEGEYKFPPELDLEFECESRDVAEKMQQMLIEDKVNFHIKMSAIGATVKGINIEITSSQVNFSDFNEHIGPKSSGIRNDKALAFSQEQIKKVFSSVAKKIKVKIETDYGAKATLTNDDIRDIVNKLTKQLIETTEIDIENLAGDDYMNIVGLSLKPNVIKEQRDKFSETISSAFNKVIENEEKKYLKNKSYKSKKSLDEMLSTDSGFSATDVKASGSYGPFSATVDVNHKNGWSRGLHQTMKNDVKNKKEFEKDTRIKMKEELSNSIYQSRQVEMEFKGEKIIPKRFKLSRVLSEKIEKNVQIHLHDVTVKEAQQGFTTDRSSFIRSQDWIVVDKTWYENHKRKIEEQIKNQQLQFEGYKINTEKQIRNEREEINRLREDHEELKKISGIKVEVKKNQNRILFANGVQILWGEVSISKLPKNKNGGILTYSWPFKKIPAFSISTRLSGWYTAIAGISSIKDKKFCTPEFQTLSYHPIAVPPDAINPQLAQWIAIGLSKD